MCSGFTTNYGLCGHQTYAKRRCQNYLARPRIRCKKLKFNETYYSLCPKCSGEGKPRSTTSKPVTETMAELNEDSMSKDEGRGTDAPGIPHSGKRERAMHGIKKIVGSIRRLKMSSSEKGNKTKVAEVQQTELSGDGGEAAEGWMTSERLANDYRTVIGKHPSSVDSSYSVRREYRRRARDVDRNTTWSAFVSQALDPEGRAEELREVEELRRADERQVGIVDRANTWAGLNPHALDPRKAEELRRADERRVGNVDRANTWAGLNPHALHPRRAEELRRADERLAQCRDGRGARTYEPGSWI
jgi:hypothetical protein